MNLRRYQILVVALFAVLSLQHVLLWQMSNRQTELAKTARAAIDESDESIELALAWKDIADRWHGLFQNSADRCTAIQGRAL